MVAFDIAAVTISPEQAMQFSRTSHDAPQPCKGCKYAAHCAGRHDHVTGATNTIIDTCELYDSYISTERMVKPGVVQVPHRVLGALKLWGMTA